MAATDRRRTIVQIIPAHATLHGEWLDGAAKPLARVLNKLYPSEQQAFLKAPWTCSKPSCAAKTPNSSLD